SHHRHARCLGIPEYEAKQYVGKILKGTVLSVFPGRVGSLDIPCAPPSSSALPSPTATFFSPCYS
ncbi:MAG: hypothetical protein ACREMY_20320, partial [bacterium]